MKILRVKSKEYHGNTYFKYRINIPESALKSSGLKEGDELKIESKRHKIILKKVKIKK
jgi:bifunctional DNA-binding transcriptional regulator/antitoxin component of YhaV-PrlF toxin-antitoxin module